MAEAAADDIMSPTQADSQRTPKPGIFWSLPPELRDMIFEVVYGTNRTVRVKTREYWAYLERMRKMEEGENFVPTTFPDSPLSHLLADKQYFEESSRCWLRSKTFQFDNAGDFGMFTSPDEPLHRFTLALITKIELLRLSMATNYRAGDKLAGLRSLSVSINSEFVLNFQANDKLPWLDDHTDFDVAKIPIIEGLLDFRGLQTINLHWSDLKRAQKPQHRAKWVAFQTQAESLLRDVVLQPEEDPFYKQKPLTLEEALKAKRSVKSPDAGYANCESVSALSDEDLPHSAGELLRICLARPNALLRWIHNEAGGRMPTIKF